MGFIEKGKKVVQYFSGFLPGSRAAKNKVTASKHITNHLLSYLIGLSDFAHMDEPVIYEQLYVWEPEIGGSIDRMSTMVGQAYQYPYIDDPGRELDEIEKAMIEDAKKIAKNINARKMFETFTEITLTQGQLFLRKTPLYGYQILPNQHVTLVDSPTRIEDPGTSVMTEANFLVLYEGGSEEAGQGQLILNKDEFIHVKYKETPVFCKDLRGRWTYGVHAVSPLHRTIIPVWWKRLVMIIDIMWRWRNVPREHHKLSSEMLNESYYSGTPTAKKAAMQADAETMLQTYIGKMNDQVPDQGLATFDTVSVEMIESKGSGYMQTNSLVDQLNTQVWSAMNMPKSMISGESHSSYASELVIANYVEQKVIQIAQKVKEPILENLRARLRDINPAYPVELLEFKMELEIAATKLEKYRTAAVMGTLHIFTVDEIREFLGFQKLREEQKKDIVMSGGFGASIPGQPGANVNPETPQSSAQHSTPPGMSQAIKATQ